ncbi:hypothetical protein MNBD_NITROSPINAE04-1033, partial [hydrothermal vent metagenome]
RRLDFKQTAAGKTLTLTITGPMTAVNLGKQGGRIARAVMGGEFSRILINLDGVDKIDSAGMGFLISLHKDALIGARSVCLCNGSKAVRRALKQGQIERLIRIFSSRKEALEKC